MREKNITYLLGAGASFHSLPIVNNMNERINSLLHILNPGNQLSNASKYKSKTKGIYEEFNRLMVEAAKHRTIDTFAKKLWLTENKDDLSKLKIMLDLYFSFEQDQSKTIYNNPTLFMQKNNEYGIWNKIGNLVDFRYDVFLATLLNKSLKLPKTVKILSWNYDNQIELAYKEYNKNSSVRLLAQKLGLHAFNENINDGDYQIINLNGQCKIFDLKEDKELDFESKLKSIIDGPWANYNTSITFAWEDSEEIKNRIDSACEIMRHTDELIVIGYSLPSFNRAIDAQLFRALNMEVERITVQCISEHYDGIAASIKEMEHWETEEHFEMTVKFYDNLDQFYIPSNQLM